jgi:hypothetical protein
MICCSEYHFLFIWNFLLLFCQKIPLPVGIILGDGYQPGNHRHSQNGTGEVCHSPSREHLRNTKNNLLSAFSSTKNEGLKPVSIQNIWIAMRSFLTRAEKKFPSTRVDSGTTLQTVSY